MNCQDYIKQPSVTDADIATYQRKYARRLVASPYILPRLRGSVPRIAYHCSFMDSDTIRFQMRSAWWKRSKRFELVGYAPKFTSEIASCFDVCQVTAGWSDKQFCEQVRRDNIDLLIELTGFSPGHRFGAMARRAAPIQVSYLNHPASSGVPNVDYIWADREALPNWTHYSETPYFFDGCFFNFDYRGTLNPPIALSPCVITGYEPTLTYGCFASIGKLNPYIVGLWADILRASGGKMILQNHGLSSAWTRRKVRGWFGDMGERVKLLPGTSRDRVLDLYAKVDVCLDTFPYCGGNTTAEALWNGVPVITLKGNRFASSYGSSLVKAAGHPQLVAHDAVEYVSIAAGLDWKWVANERGLTRDRAHKLWDTTAFAARLEQAYDDLLQAPAKADIARLRVDDKLLGGVTVQ